MLRAVRPNRFPAVPVVLAGLFLSSLACTSIPFLAPTATPTPTSTPTFTLTPTQTQTSTSTPTATLAPTSTSTPTSSYLDWRVAFSDTFDDEYGGWYTGHVDDEYGTADVSITGGKYLMKVNAKKPVFRRFSTDLSDQSDFHLSVEVKKNKGSEETDSGLFFRRSVLNYYYYFSINATKRQYSFYCYFDDEWVSIARWTRSSLIDPTGTNQIAVLAQGSRFTLFINGEELDTFEDDTLNEGTVGLGIGIGNAGDTLELEFDNFEVTAPKKPR